MLQSPVQGLSWSRVYHVLQSPLSAQGPNLKAYYYLNWWHVKHMFWKKHFHVETKVDVIVVNGWVTYLIFILSIHEKVLIIQ